MKTTIDIADNIMERSKQVARAEKSTFRDLVEEGLLLVIERRTQSKKTEIKPVTVKGNGLTAEFRGASWSQIRQAAYEGHGG